MSEIAFHTAPVKEWSLTRVALLIVGLLFFPEVSRSNAGPCTTDIEQIENEMSQSNSESGSTNRKSGGAQLGWQPPPLSVARAKMKTDAHYLAAMDRARSLDAEGNAGCMRVVREIKNMIGM